MGKSEQDIWWDLFDDMRDHLYSSSQVKEAESNMTSNIEHYMIDCIKEALKEANNNQTHAAKKLGISRECLIYKIKKYTINF